VSSKKKELVQHTIELFGLTDYIDLVIGQGDFKNPKPDPESILMAINTLESKNTLYVGDTLSDIKAAKGANVKSCGVLYSASIEELLEEKPDYVIKNMTQLTEICGE
ncbi:MAG: HAD-IA family hydrolase, partial [Acholeplasmatales bacterium]|nr:HAD-IA family hydrolase [Acholeplasmatales bacterium]